LHCCLRFDCPFAHFKGRQTWAASAEGIFQSCHLSLKRSAAKTVNINSITCPSLSLHTHLHTHTFTHLLYTNTISHLSLYIHTYLFEHKSTISLHTHTDTNTHPLIYTQRYHCTHTHTCTKNTISHTQIRMHTYFFTNINTLSLFRTHLHTERERERERQSLSLSLSFSHAFNAWNINILNEHYSPKICICASLYPRKFQHRIRSPKRSVWRCCCCCCCWCWCCKIICSPGMNNEF